MRVGIIIPAHNEEAFLEQTLNSLVNQQIRPYKIVVVNDNSMDSTQTIIDKFTEEYDFIISKYRKSDAIRMPGAKIVSAFNSAIDLLGEVDIICKFDADLIFGETYIKDLVLAYQTNPKLGMFSGVCTILKNNTWEIENLTSKDHIRGALKSYRMQCFKAIGGLKESMGWDTADELLAKYFNWEVKVNESLFVKHLKPTASVYNQKSVYMQGAVFYKLHYGFLLSLIACIKLAVKKKSFKHFFNYIIGYFKAILSKEAYLVDENQGKWIRNYRWGNIFKKIKHFI